MPLILYKLIYFFLALHCLSPSYHFFLLAPKVKWEAAARSFSEYPSRDALQKEGFGPPPSWWLRTLTLRARCQSHLLTQAFTSKGGSQHTDSPFEDASSLAYFLFPLLRLAFELLHPEDGGVILMGKHHAPEFTSDLFTYNRLWQLQTWKILMCLHGLLYPNKFHTGFWKKLVFSFFSLFFRTHKHSLPNNLQKQRLCRETQAAGPTRGRQRWKEPAVGENLAGPKSSLILLFSSKNKQSTFPL